MCAHPTHLPNYNRAKSYARKTSPILIRLIGKQLEILGIARDCLNRAAACTAFELCCVRIKVEIYLTN